jgi:hypothetical protein
LLDATKGPPWLTLTSSWLPFFVAVIAYPLAEAAMSTST